MIEVYCDDCKKWFRTDSDDKYNHDTYCEDCGTHCAYKCPECEGLVDSVWAKERDIHEEENQDQEKQEG